MNRTALGLTRPSTPSFIAKQGVDARDIGERSDAVLRTAMRGHDVERTVQIVSDRIRLLRVEFVFLSE